MTLECRLLGRLGELYERDELGASFRCRGCAHDVGKTQQKSREQKTDIAHRVEGAEREGGLMRWALVRITPSQTVG